VAIVSLGVVPGVQAQTVETVARGLDNPRGVALGPDGNIYVANAGRAGRRCVGEGDEQRCFGLSGKVVRVTPGGRVRTVAGRFASLAGPDGSFAGGVHGVSVAPGGTVFAVTGSATPRDVRSFPTPARRQAGRLFDLTGGDLDAVARIDRVEWENNVDRVRGDRNSNPYAVLALADRQLVVDAGANAVFEVRGRRVTLFAVIPKNRRRDSVPSSIALGPDGNVYVGELAEGAGRRRARVWRIPAAGGDPVVHATGFTFISGLAFGPDGSMFVTEFARSFERGDFRGSVVRVQPDGTRTRLGSGDLVAPTGAAVDAAGAVYVSNASVAPRSTPRQSPFRGAGGALVKITP
jgi:sugar lactone lactonase YvrE